MLAANIQRYLLNILIMMTPTAPIHPNTNGKARPVAQPLVTLDQIFDGSLFRIPDYQRGYAWGAEEYGAFWNDVLRMGEERVHYTGQLTVRGVPDAEAAMWREERDLLDEGYVPYFVVDGQQRLTTVVILLKCLTEAMDPNQKLAGLSKGEIEAKYLYRSYRVGGVFLFGYAVQGASYEYFKEHVLGQKSIQVHQADSVYTLNLKDAREFFTAKLSEIAPEKLGTVFEAVTQRMLFNWSELTDGLDEFVVFETMNNRGKKVSNFELLKNRLIHLSRALPNTDTPERRNLRDYINTVWASAYEELGRARNA